MRILWIFLLVALITAPRGLGALSSFENKLLEAPEFYPAFGIKEDFSAQTDFSVFSVITYNVAGLPQLISKSFPIQNLPLIGKKLNAFSLALVQEDFFYPQKLRKSLAYPFRTRAQNRWGSHDGLSQFSIHPFHHFERVVWNACSGRFFMGADCLAPKGFSFSVVDLPNGSTIHVYNIHLDAGFMETDQAARYSQLKQLGHFIKQNSKDASIIVAGDFNLHWWQNNNQDKENFKNFLAQTELSDTCALTKCPKYFLDHMLYRSGKENTLTAKTWEIPKGFMDNKGHKLSDHQPIVVTFSSQKI